MGVKLFRIDDRLIHGQVISGWARVTAATRVLILDDVVAKDELSLSLFKMASPPGVSVEAVTVEDGIKLLKEELKDNTIVLFRTPKEAKQVYDAGVSMPKLNVGGCGSKPGRTNFYRNVHLTPDEVEILREMAKDGVVIELQMVPDGSQQNINNIK